MFTRVGLLISCLIAFIVISVADAQDPSNGWQIPRIECNGEQCIKSEVVDAQGNLYIYVQHHQPSRQAMLYLIPYGTSQFTEYDLLQLYSQGRGIRTHFVPFANNKVVVFDYQAIAPLTLLDLQSETVAPLDVNMPGNIEECNIFTFLIGAPSLYRIGPDGVLFCSQDHGNHYLHLARLFHDQLVLEHSIEMGGSVTPERDTPPWLYLANSLDGKIYIVPYPGTLILDQLAPQYADSYDGSNYLVLSYDPATGSWRTTIIQNDAERWKGSEHTSSLAPFIGVDEVGNLYFWHNLYTDDGLHASDFVKYNSQGEKIWHLTEGDFGGRPFRPLLVGENQFILDFGGGDLQYVKQDE